MTLFATGYYSARVGFPNQSFTNGKYNSFVVVCAHTAMADGALNTVFPQDTAQKAGKASEVIHIGEKTRLRSLEVLQILRGEKQGILTEEDARIFYHTYLAAAKLYGEPIGHHPYMNPQQIQNDPKRQKLEQAINDPNWRVIRIQCGNHYYVFVRNSDGKTVDSISDSTITRNYMTLDAVLNFWKREQEWVKTHLSFYPPQETMTSEDNNQVIYKGIEIEAIDETRPVVLENCLVKEGIKAPKVTLKQTVVEGDVKTKEFELDQATIKGTLFYMLDPKDPNRSISDSVIAKICIGCPKGFNDQYTGIPILDVRSSKVGEFETDEMENGMRILSDGGLARSVTVKRHSAY